MAKKEFNPKKRQSKLVVSTKTSDKGIRYLWYWNEKSKEYKKPSKVDDQKKFVAYRVRDGRQEEKRFQSKKKAFEWRFSKEDEQRKKNSSMTYSDLLNEFFRHIKGQVVSGTYQTYRNNSNHTKKLLGHFKLSSFSHQTIDHWLKVVKQKDYLSSQHATRNSYQKEIALLRMVFDYYISYIDGSFVNPVLKRHTKDSIIDIKKYKQDRSQKQLRYMNPEEIEKFLVSLHDSSKDSDYRYFFYGVAILQIYSGLRIGEACALKVRDFVSESTRGALVNVEKTVYWKRGKQDEDTHIQGFTKTGEQRTVPIPDFVKDALLRIIKRNGSSPSSLIFSRDGIQPLPYRTIQKVYNSIFINLGLSFRSTHIMRHTYATDFLEKTGNQHALKKLLGHSSLRQTEVYAKVTDRSVDESISSYKKLVGNKQENVVFLEPKLG